MTLSGLKHDRVVQYVCRFDAEHSLPGIVGEAGQALCLGDPGVPQDGRGRAGAGEPDASVPALVDEAERVWQVEVDAVGLAAEMQVALLLAPLPVLQGVDIGTVGEALDGD